MTKFPLSPTGMSRRQRNAAHNDNMSVVTEVLHDAKSKVGNILLDFDLSEAWQQDNHYILSHYRQVSYSCKKSFASILQLHNETVNIITHLIPAILLALILSFIVLDKFLSLSIVPALWSYLATIGHFESASRGDAVMIGTFVIGACSMFTASSSFHTLSNHSPHVAQKMNQVDYVGIICMMYLYTTLTHDIADWILDSARSFRPSITDITVSPSFDASGYHCSAHSAF